MTLIDGAAQQMPAAGVEPGISVNRGQYRPRPSGSLVRGVVASRLLVLAAGATGAVFGTRLPGWSTFDPTKLSSSLGVVGNVFAASAVRWDSIHYLSIASQGYKPAADTGFFPFYPLLIHVLGWIVGSDVVAGLLISIASFAIALALLHRLCREELGRRVADATVLLLAFAPLSLFFTAIYTESLFLALSVGTFYLARHGEFTWACVTAACAAVTHVQGIALCAPLAYMYWESCSRHGDGGLHKLLTPRAAGLALPPASLFGLFLYMHEIGFGWLAPFTGSSPTSHGHSIAPIIPLHTSIYVRTVVGPIVTIWRAVEAGVSGLWQTLHGTNPFAPGLGDLFSPGFQNLIYLAVLVIVVCGIVGAWRWLPKAYAIYSVAVLLVFTISVVTIVPLRAFDRYMLTLFPVWMCAAKWLDKRGLLRPVLMISSLMLVVYTEEVARWVGIA